MYVFILITHVFQGESSGINICKEVIIIEFREHYKKKKNLPRNSSPGSEGFTGKSCQTLRGELAPILLKLTPNFLTYFKIFQRKEHFQTHFVRLPSL